MEKLVKKRIYYTQVSGLIYDPEDKEMVAYENELPGKLSVQRAQVRARRLDNDNTIVVQDVEHVSKVMAITMDTFLDLAEEVN